MIQRMRIFIKTLVFLLAVSFSFCVSCLAMDTGGDAAIHEGFQKISEMYIYRLNNPKGKICCMDVNPATGDCLIGLAEEKESAVSVYDKEGNFLAAYSFSSGSSAFEVLWVNDLIGIWISRSDYVVLIDSQSDTCQRVHKNSVSVNIYEYMTQLQARQREVNGTVYKRQSQMGPFSWLISFSTQLIITTPEGKSIMAYDVNNEYAAETITMYVLGILLVVTAVVVLTRTIKKSRKKYVESEKQRKEADRI